MKSLFLQAATYNMLEFIARKNRKSISQFLDALAIQEYSEYQDKPFKKSVLKPLNLYNTECFPIQEETKSKT